MILSPFYLYRGLSCEEMVEGSSGLRSEEDENISCYYTSLSDRGRQNGEIMYWRPTALLKSNRNNRYGREERAFAGARRRGHKALPC